MHFIYVDLPEYKDDFKGVEGKFYLEVSRIG